MGESPIIRLLEKVEMFLYRQAACIVSVTNSFKRILVVRGVAGDKIEVITNGVDLAGFCPRDKDAELSACFDLEGTFVAGYVGTHGMAHALETILEAAARVKKMGGGDGYRFILLGNGARKQALMERTAQMGLTNVVFIDSVPKAEVARYWSILDVSIIHLRKTELFTTVIPSKLFECMGMGIPVLHGVAGESAEIVEKEGVGLTFEPENVAELCDKLEAMRRDETFYRQFRENCLTAASRYDRSDLAGRMLNILKRVER